MAKKIIETVDDSNRRFNGMLMYEQSCLACQQTLITLTFVVRKEDHTSSRSSVLLTLMSSEQFMRTVWQKNH